MRTCVYVAGAYSADNVITVLNNMRKGMRMAARLMMMGYSPFCPWVDFHFQLMLRDQEALEVHDYYEYSMAWLNKSDCMLVLPHYENSIGTLAEIKYAKEQHIPIYYNVEELFNNVPRKAE